MEYEVRSRALGRVAAEGDTLIVSYDYMAGERVPLRTEYRDAIIALEGRDLPPIPRRGGQTENVG